MKTKILITGDFYPLGRNLEYIKKNNIDLLFGEFLYLIKKVDFAITNLEGPITNNETKLSKTGANFKFPFETAIVLDKIGFNAVTLANNHIMDYGAKGLENTISILKKHGILFLGAGKTYDDASEPLKIEINEKKISFINFTENEFGNTSNNNPGANPLDVTNLFHQIKETKSISDFVIVITHGGREHYQLPTPEQRKRDRFFIDAGADVVIGHHPHAYSGYEKYKNKWIFYSLGNFIFDYKKKYQRGHWTEGFALELLLDKKTIDFKLHPFFQGRQNDKNLKLMSGKQLINFENNIKKLNEIIRDDELFIQSWKSYIKTQEINYLNLIFIRNKYLRFLLTKMGVNTSFLFSKEYKNIVLNLNRCETHNEMLKNILDNQ